MAGHDIEEIVIANTTASVGSRMEPRYNDKGELRGVCWRQRNAERKTVFYVGAKSKGNRQEQFERLKSKFGRNDPPASVGSLLDRLGSVGKGAATHYLQ